MNKRPNILLIVMDSVRSSNLSCYGYHRPTTPNIDAFARQGTLFENTVSEGCWTLPVHTSLFTGLYALNHGVTISKSALPENHPTLAHRLREAGYQTCCLTSNAYISPNTGLTNGFDTVEEVWRITSPRGIKRTKMSQLKMQLRKLGLIGAPLIVALRLLSRLRRILKGQKTKSDKGAALTNQLAEKWLANRSADKPFFLFINYMECHEKYEPTAPYDRKFMPQQYSKWRVSQVSPDKKHVLKGSEKRKKEDVEIMTALYDGELNYLDQKISELLAALNSNSLLDDTVVVITSDHGDSLGEHNELGHRMVLYEQLVHVPLIVRYPKIFKSGDRVPNLVQLADLFPTLLELGGVTSQKEKSNGFLSLCNLENLGRREFVVAENTAPKSLSSMEMKAIRNERYKLIWKSNDELELYDLLHDPLEEKNLIREQPAEAERLRQYLEKWKGAHAFQLESREAVFDDELSERLRALGYVN